MKWADWTVVVNACLLSVVKRFMDPMMFDSGNIDSTVVVMTGWSETQQSEPAVLTYSCFSCRQPPLTEVENSGEGEGMVA